jgi:hypothetical protein
MNDTAIDYSRFQKVYANLPDKLREDIVAVIDEKPYSWNAAYLEISSGTQLGKRIFVKLVDMEIV